MKTKKTCVAVKIGRPPKLKNRVTISAALEERQTDWLKARALVGHITFSAAVRAVLDEAMGRTPKAKR